MTFISKLTSTMQELDLKCTVCEEKFKLASSLLQHFAHHVNTKKQKKLPELVPINSNNKINSQPNNDIDPMKYCSVILDDNRDNQSNESFYKYWADNFKNDILTKTDAT